MEVRDLDAEAGKALEKVKERNWKVDRRKGPYLEGAEGWWGMKGFVYGKMGFRCLGPCRLAEKCIMASGCRLEDGVKADIWCQSPV